MILTVPLHVGLALPILHGGPPAAGPSSRKMTAIKADTRAVPPARRGWSWAAWLFAFACFFPYPALAIGRTTGLQASQAAALAA